MCKIGFLLNWLSEESEPPVKAGYGAVQHGQPVRGT